MRRRWLAFILACATVLSLLGASAAATGEAQTTGKTLAFDSVAGLVMRNNNTVLSLDETIAMLNEMDYDEMESALEDGLAQIAESQQMMNGMTDGVSASIEGLLASYQQIANTFAKMQGGMSADFSDVSELLTGYVTMTSKQSAATIENSRSALEQQLNDIASGKMQEENERTIRQLETTQKQLVMAAQSLYIGLLGMQRSDAAITRSLGALDRKITEMELRCKMGQISELQLQQVRGGRTQLESGQQTLRMNMELISMQLNSMIGAVVSEKLTLQPLAAVTEQQLAAMDFANDYKKAEKVSYEVYAAQKTLDDAKKSYEETVREYGANESRSLAAEHSYQAAQYTYRAAIQSYSIKFRTLYLQVKDYAQVLAAAQESLRLKKEECKAAELKYQRGTISQNAYLDICDEVASAEDTAASAASDLYSAYCSYCWAVDSGILN